jgi:acyl-CoA thioester hydrolase
MVRVYYEDTDAAGIVYHASYLKFAERGRTELLRSLGFEHRRLAAEHGVVFAVARCAVDFRGPARLDDLLAVRTEVVELSGERVERAGTVLTQLTITLAALATGAMRPVRLPAALRQAFGAVRSSETLPLTLNPEASCRHT